MKESIKEYQINTTGISNGLTIPSGFIISTDAIYVTGTDTNVINLESQVNTYTDNTRTALIPNDDISNVLKNEGTLIAIDETTDQIVVVSGLFDLLESVYGEGNVVLI